MWQPMRTLPKPFHALAVVLILFSASRIGAQESGQVFTPSDFQWKPARVPGMETAQIIGDQFKPGPYVAMIKFPAKIITTPHSHSETRQYTVISGTLYIGWGEQFDATKLQSLPPGSFYTEPSNTPHFVATKGDPVVVQVTGIGPVATNFIVRASGQEKTDTSK
jgi:hypothetical protein